MLDMDAANNPFVVDAARRVVDTVNLADEMERWCDKLGSRGHTNAAKAFCEQVKRDRAYAIIAFAKAFYEATDRPQEAAWRSRMVKR
jgi:hypothetical protein